MPIKKEQVIHNLPTGPGPQIARTEHHLSSMFAIIELIFAIIGFIVVAVIVTGGLVQAAQLSSPWTSSLFQKTTPATPASPLNMVASPTPTITKTVETPKPTSLAHSINSGQADLSVYITSATIDQNGNGVVTFDISNIGGSSTGVWYFTAQLPTPYGYTYASPAQISLAPGAHIANVLNFSGGIGGVVSIQIDPTNSVRETNEGDNYASRAVEMNGYYQQPYTY